MSSSAPVNDRPLPDGAAHLDNGGRVATPGTSPGWLVFVLIFAAMTHGAFYFFQPEPASRSPDEQEYLHLAEQLVERGYYALPGGVLAKRAPLYPLFLAAVRKTQPADVWRNGAQLVQTVLAWAATVLLAMTAARLGGAMAGLMAGIISALYAPFLYLQMAFLSEILVLFLLALALFVYVRGIFGSERAAGQHGALLVVSLCVGLAALARLSAIVLLVPFAAHTVVVSPRRATWLSQLLLLVVPAVFVLLPWIIRNQRTLGVPTIATSGGLNFYLGNNPDYAANPGLDAADYDIYDRLLDRGQNEIEADRTLYARGWAFIRGNPGEAVVNLGRKLVVFFTPTVQRGGPVLPVVLLGFAGVVGLRCRRTGARCRALAIVSAIGMTGCLVWWWMICEQAPVPYITPVYLLPPAVLAMVWWPWRLPARGLLLGIVLSQVAVGLVFIPLTRLRWPIDGVFIITLAVGAGAVLHLINDVRFLRHI